MAEANHIVLLTRTREQSEAVAAILRGRLGRDLHLLISPILRIEFLPVARALEDYPTLAFTSVHGVAALLGKRSVAGKQAVCVGRRTAEAAEELGMIATHGEGGVEELAQHILDTAPLGPILHLRGEHVRGDLVGELQKAGIEADETVVYRQVEVPLSGEAKAALLGNARVIVPVFSPRSAALVAKAAVGATAPLDVVAISEATANAWTGPARTVTIAEAPDASSMIDAIETTFKR